MPDWSYAPLFRPLLFRLPAERARALTLGLIGGLGRRPGGAAMIAFLGHMDPPAELRRCIAGLDIRTPIGLGAGLDVDGYAAPSLSRFEVGHVELGPVTLAPVVAAGPIERREREEAIVYPDLPVNPGLDALLRNLATAQRFHVPIGVRLAHRPGASSAEAADERRQLITALAPLVDFFTLDTSAPASGAWSAADWVTHLDALLGGDAVSGTTLPTFLCLAPDLAPKVADALFAPARERGIAGVVVTGGIAVDSGQRLVGAPTRKLALHFVQGLRERHGDPLVIFAGGGVQQPADALALLDAGADLVQLHSGLIYNGPGLPKRTNEALLKSEVAHSGGNAFSIAGRIQGEVFPTPDFRFPTSSWLAFACLGLGMIISGSLAWYVAIVRIILPYDEYFVGMTREELTSANARLLSFMAHDRISLAGSMVAIGILYVALAWGGVRRGHHWAWSALLASSGFGFLSFFLFLGFDYFDPLHALISLILLPFWLIGIIWSQPRGTGDYDPPSAGLRNTRAWRLSLVGQLCFVMLGAGLIVGGLAIVGTGITQVFVPSDLAFMETEGPFLREISPRLVPLVAHDRAGFGGTLVTTGLAVLFAGLWGIRPGVRWLWWGLLLSGIPGLGGAIGVHYAVGYTDFLHLSPVWLALFLYLMGLGLTHRSCMEGWGHRSVG
jgi:dihydroorotate dehydrogenase